MDNGQILSADYAGIWVSAAAQGAPGEIRLEAGVDATVSVEAYGFGLAPGMGKAFATLAEPRDGKWSLTFVGRLPAGLAALLEHWVCNFALARLDDISHSLTGDRRKRLDTMERLHAAMTGACGVSASAPKTVAPSYRDLPPPVMVQTSVGPLVVLFGSDRLADVCVPDPANPALPVGSVRFRRGANGEWRPVPQAEWDLGRCAGRLGDDPWDTVRHVMMPVLAGAARHHEDTMAAMPTPVEETLPPRAVAGTVEALAQDIVTLRGIVASEPDGAAPSFGNPRIFSRKAA